MGLYDTFSSRDGKVVVQLKNGYCSMHHYTEGGCVDHEEFPDGAYYGYEGTVLIRNSIVEQVTENPPGPSVHGLLCVTKWGESFDPKTETLDGYSPVVAAMEAVRARPCLGATRQYRKKASGDWTLDCTDEHRCGGRPCGHAIRETK